MLHAVSKDVICYIGTPATFKFSVWTHWG